MPGCVHSIEAFPDDLPAMGHSPHALALERRDHELVEVRFEGGFLHHRRVLMCQPQRTMLLERNEEPVTYVKSMEGVEDLAGEARRIAIYVASGPAAAAGASGK